MAYEDSGLPKTIKEFAGKVEIKLAAACEAGDLLGYSSGWVLATQASTAVLAELVAGQNGAIGDVITAYKLAVVGGAISGATAGNPVYLGDAGKVSETAGANAVQAVGKSLKATELLLCPGFPSFITVAQQAHIADAPAGGTGAAEGAWDTAGHRDTAIASINAILDVLEAYGMVATS